MSARVTSMEENTNSITSSPSAVCFLFPSFIFVITGTSGNLAAVLDFWHTTSHETGSTTIRKLDPENIGGAVGILSLCGLELEICLGVFLPPSPRCRQTSQKTDADAIFVRSNFSLQKSFCFLHISGFKSNRCGLTFCF